MLFECTDTEGGKKDISSITGQGRNSDSGEAGRYTDDVSTLDPIKFFPNKIALKYTLKNAGQT